MKQRIASLIAGGVLALALFGVARAGPFEDAQEADQKGDYATELQILRPLAEQGNALAQLGLDLMYAKGQGVPQDYAQAFVWCRKAAEQGDADAQTIASDSGERSETGQLTAGELAGIYRASRLLFPRRAKRETADCDSLCRRPSHTRPARLPDSRAT